jgi:hypothetical protein
VDDTGMQPPRGVARLRVVGWGVERAREREACGVGWAAGAGRAKAGCERGRARAGSWAASANGLKVRRWPVYTRKAFSNFCFNEFFKYQVSNTILSIKMTFF